MKVSGIMKSTKLFLLIFMFVVLILSACNKDNNITQIPNAGFLLYATDAPVEDKDIEKYVGEIEEKVSSKDELKDWYSMYLEKGTEIYLIKNSEDSDIKYAYKKNDGNCYSLNPRVN
ncbi:hypothetical protein RV11_GL000093 [Enterococcus phoeniculicola]|jgi:hypothetical protein|nr:hypothetical protein RV11_GL000093 [Enterococcus phoeniculicola]